MYEEIISHCEYLLENCPFASNAKSYLDSRINFDTQKVFNFGFFPPKSNIGLLTSHFDLKKLEDLRLYYSKNIENSVSRKRQHFLYFENYPLIMPYKNLYGSIIGIVGRTLLSSEEMKELKISKYKNTVFKKGQNLFGLFENKETIYNDNYAIIVEGQFDMISCYENNIRNVVAIGSSNMTPIQMSLLKRFTDRVYLLLDNDEAGDKGRKLIHDKFNKFIDIKDIRIPLQYKDVDDCLKASQKNFSILDYCL